MNLFLDSISPKSALMLFNDERKILYKYFFDWKNNESTFLINEINNFLESKSISYTDLNNLIVVNWPGGFTWIRVIVLIINTINFVIKKNITTLSYFDLFDKYPIIKTSSKRDCFFKKNIDSKIEVLKNEEILNYIDLNKIKKIYWDFFISDKILLDDIPDYDNIIKNIIFNDYKIISPYYIKKPNIN